MKGLSGFLFLLMLTTAVFAQSPTDEEILSGLKGSVTLAESKDYPKLASELRFILAQVEQKIVSLVVDVLNQPFGNWMPEVKDSNTAGMAFLGGGFNLKIDFTNKSTNEVVRMEVVGNSPLVQTLSMYTNNAMFLAQSQEKSLVRLGTEYKGLYDSKAETLQLIYLQNLVNWKAIEVKAPRETLLEFGNEFANNRAPQLDELMAK